MLKGRIVSFLLPLIGVASFGALLWSTLPARVELIKNTYQLYAPPPLANVRSDILNVLLLGQKPIYDDFISIYLLQTLMQEGVKKEAEPLMEQIRSVIRHHPRLETTYMLSCFVMLLEVKRPEFCREINLAGLKAFPMSWRLLMTQAYIEYSAMNQPAQAASFFTMAARTPNAPEYVLKAAKKLLSTRTLTDSDIEESMKIIADEEINSQFKQILEGIQKTKSQQGSEQKSQEAPSPINVLPEINIESTPAKE